VLWYNDDMFEFRVAANYLGKQYLGQYSNWTTDPLKDDAEKGILGGLDRWADSTLYVDLGATYHITDKIDTSLNVQNLTEEGVRSYLHWEDFSSMYFNFERRITLGVSAKF
jgi:iron complex outermembrane recepter protein